MDTTLSKVQGHLDKPKFWYFITEYYCPQCGRSDTYKDKRLDERPNKWEDRHEIIEAWDYCD